MALYARPRPTTGIKALGCLCALAAVGLSALYPLVLFGASWTLGKVDEAMMVDLGEPSRAVTPASYLIAWTTIYSFILTALCFGAAFCFVGIDRWLTKDATMSHRDVVAARFPPAAHGGARLGPETILDGVGEGVRAGRAVGGRVGHPGAVDLDGAAGRGLIEPHQAHRVADGAEAAQEAGESCIEVWGGGDDDLALWRPGRLRVRECSMPMLRVVDVVRALEERGWPADVAGQWCFDIADPLIPANTGAWVLELEGGRAHVSASATRGFPVSLPRLAQLVAGVLPAVDETVPADLARASALRPWAGIFEF